MSEDTVKVTYANAGALGFIGFGLTTVLLSLSYATLYSSNTMLLAMFIFMGGLAEVIAGLMLWKMGDTFSMLAFGSFGFFWLSLAGLNLHFRYCSQPLPQIAILLLPHT